MGSLLDTFGPSQRVDPAYLQVRTAVARTPAATLRFFAAVPSADRVTVAESLMSPEGAVAWAGDLLRGMTRLACHLPPDAPPAAVVALCDDLAARPLGTGTCDNVCVGCGFPRVSEADASPCPCCGAAGVVPARPEGEGEYLWQVLARRELGVRIGRLAASVAIWS